MGKKDIDLREYLRHVMELETEIHCQRQIVKKADELKAKLPYKPTKEREKKDFQKERANKEELEALLEITDPRKALVAPEAPKTGWVTELIAELITAAIFVAIGVCILWAGAMVFGLPVSFMRLFYIILVPVEVVVAAIRIPKLARKKRNYVKEKAKFDEEYAKAEKEYNKLKTESEKKHKKRSAELEREQQNREKLLDMKYDDEVKQWELRCEEINNNVQEAKNVAHRLLVPIREAETTLSKLYATDVIYPKYRSMAAVCTIYEYLASGRCQELEGPNGAYNLYESELRQEMIIDKLDIVIENLENIQRNQYQLYVKLNTIESTIRSIDLKLSNIAYSTSSIARDVGKIRDNTEKIARSAQITAFASAITAQCASIAAKNTQAIKYISLIK